MRKKERYRQNQVSVTGEFYRWLRKNAYSRGLSIREYSDEVINKTLDIEEAKTDL